MTDETASKKHWRVIYKDRKEHGEALLSWPCLAPTEEAARDAWAHTCAGDEILDVEEWPFYPRKTTWMPKDPAATFPKSAFTVLNVKGDLLELAPMGGGLGGSMLVKKFLENFREPTEEELAAASQARLAIFSLDWGPCVVGFSWGQRWNGWGCPTLEKESLSKWMEETLDGEESMTLEWKDGKLFHVWEPYDDDDPGREEIEPEKVFFDGKEYECYDVSLSWCWHEYDADDLKRWSCARKQSSRQEMSGNPTELITT